MTCVATHVFENIRHMTAVNPTINNMVKSMLYTVVVLFEQNGNIFSLRPGKQ